MELLKNHFPNLSELQNDQFEKIEELYKFWNAQINVISRKDIEFFNTRHLLHSLSIGMFTTLKNGGKVLDVGTGGGFPGIPLAILYPEIEFTLVDSIGKKIKVVKEVAQALDLKNVNAKHIRAEEVKGEFDYVLSRAVTRLTPFYLWIHDKIDFSRFTNSGFYALKGGDLGEEIKLFQSEFKDAHVEQYKISQKLEDEFFETKKILFIN